MRTLKLVFVVRFDDDSIAQESAENLVQEVKQEVIDRLELETEDFVSGYVEPEQL